MRKSILIQRQDHSAIQQRKFERRNLLSVYLDLRNLRRTYATDEFTQPPNLRSCRIYAATDLSNRRTYTAAELTQPPNLLSHRYISNRRTYQPPNLHSCRTYAATELMQPPNLRSRRNYAATDLSNRRTYAAADLSNPRTYAAADFSSRRLRRIYTNGQVWEVRLGIRVGGQGLYVVWSLGLEGWSRGLKSGPTFFGPQVFFGL